MELPQPLEHLLTSYSWTEIIIGASSAQTFRLERPGRETYYLKTAERSPGKELLAEKKVLEWLHGKPFAPEVVLWGEDKAADYLLLTAIPGTDAASLTDGTPGAELIKLLAQGLRFIHQIPAGTCPFNRSLAMDIETARFNVYHNLVDEDDFHEPRRGRSARELYHELLLQRPQKEDLVITHGDYCLPNVIIDNGAVSGFVDWGRAGVSDRYKDLAVAIRSIKRNLGPGLERAFLEAYGVSNPDAKKIEYYQLLDEFF